MRTAQVIDAVTKKKVPITRDLIPVVTAVVQAESGDFITINGYTTDPSKIAQALLDFKEPGNGPVSNVVLDKFRDKLYFSKKDGVYRIRWAEDKRYIQNTCIMARGIYTYSFSRKYEALENFSFFNGKQQILEKSEFPISPYLNYTFGLEFETSQGIIPQDLCFRDGLIPLRDGSISGLEYSTVVLSGNDGISLLRQQLRTLREYTTFDKECSLHIHMGGFPLTSDAIFRLYQTCKGIEPEISRIVPKYTFSSSSYKASGKDYCNFLPNFRTFEDMYGAFVGRQFFGSFTEPHPNDPGREAKWRIPTRYYWVNFINALCYNVNKTIEFRLLRPTYNFEKIQFWIYVFNAILLYSESKSNCPRNGVDLKRILEFAYPPEISGKLLDEKEKLYCAVVNQCGNNDSIGNEVKIEDILFGFDTIL